jgi:hypothetical protein
VRFIVGYPIANDNDMAGTAERMSGSGGQMIVNLPF